VLDKLMRIAKTRISTATIRVIPELGVTRIEIPYINKGWRAGQHVRIQVLSSAMGVTGWAQVHPFTIASESNSKEGLVLMCKKTGTWTHKLFATAATSHSEKGVGRDVRIVVEGPYGAFCPIELKAVLMFFLAKGGPGFVMFNSFSAAVFVVGGSGITFALGALQELIQQDLRGECRVRVMGLFLPSPHHTA
jgi:ferric-chelate reductase